MKIRPGKEQEGKHNAEKKKGHKRHKRQNQQNPENALTHTMKLDGQEHDV